MPRFFCALGGLSCESCKVLKLTYVEERGVRVDWIKIKTEYVTTDTTYRELAEKYGISQTQVANHSKDEGWRKLREEHLQNICLTTKVQRQTCST